VEKAIIPNTQPGLRCHVVSVWVAGGAEVVVRKDSIVGWETRAATVKPSPGEWPAWPKPAA
jgi:hypothetical protein